MADEDMKVTTGAGGGSSSNAAADEYMWQPVKWWTQQARVEEAAKLAAANEAIMEYSGYTLEELKAEELEAAQGLLLLKLLPNQLIQAQLETVINPADNSLLTPEIIIDIIGKEIIGTGQKGGSRKYKQRGGATWEEAGIAIRNLANRVANVITGAGGVVAQGVVAVADAATIQNAVIAAGWGAAGWAVVFGPPDFAWLNDVLLRVVMAIPQAALTNVYNTAIAMVSIGKTAFFVGVITSYVVFVVFLIIFLKKFTEIVRGGEANYKIALNDTLYIVCYKLKLLKLETALRGISPTNRMKLFAPAAVLTAEQQAILERIQRENVAVVQGDEQPLVAAINAAVDAAPRNEIEARANNIVMNDNIALGRRNIRLINNSMLININNNVESTVMRRAINNRRSRASSITAGGSGSNAAAGGSGGGRGQGGGRRKTRKHHSRRHKRRQSHRHKRRG